MPGKPRIKPTDDVGPALPGRRRALAGRAGPAARLFAWRERSTGPFTSALSPLGRGAEGASGRSRGCIALGAVVFDRQVAQLRRAAVLVVHEADAGHEGLDDVDLLQRRDDQQLQVELLEQAQAVLGRFVRAAAEGLVDDDEAERARARRAPFQAELVGQARRQESACSRRHAGCCRRKASRVSMSNGMGLRSSHAATVAIEPRAVGDPVIVLHGVNERAVATIVDDLRWRPGSGCAQVSPAHPLKSQPFPVDASSMMGQATTRFKAMARFMSISAPFERRLVTGPVRPAILKEPSNDHHPDAL